ncbi:MAG: leucine-rich repeat protein, partial [Clostridia bacterium]|nr:leucine-rich repeat protein [Clostridia bacterium]
MKNNGLNIFNIDENGVITGLCDTINIPEGVTKIGHGSFYGDLTKYDFITEVNIPASCEEIEANFIRNYDNAIRFFVSSENKNFISENGVIYTVGKKKLIKYPAGKVCDIFFVPDEVEEIGEYAFADAKNVSGIMIGKNCRSIGENAFDRTTYTILRNNNCGAITGDNSEYLGIRKYYISPSVQDLAHDIFDGDWCEDGVFYENVIVGGTIGSAIWEHCNKCNIPFLEVSEEDAEAFLATPYEELVER